MNVYSEIKHVIGVVSEKRRRQVYGDCFACKYAGGPEDTASASWMQILPGPSIPRMYGLKGPAQADDEGIYPVLTDNDIKVMSINC